MAAYSGVVSKTVKRITKAGALVPGGHYALATSVNGLTFVSGLLPVRADADHSLSRSPFDAQMAQVFAHLDDILAEAGAERGQVAKLTVYLADIALWSDCNQLCADYFASDLPARCIVPVPELHYGYLVEIEAVVVTAE